jgi:hypothetical protein
MKKLLFTAMLATFAVAVQAGDTKATKETPACCAGKATTQTKATCSSAQAKSSCSGSSCKEGTMKQALLSPKAAGEVAKRL